MAIALVNTPSTDTATVTGFGSTITIPSVTVGAGESLVVTVAMRDGGRSITNVTFDGTNMTEAVEIQGALHSAIWYDETPTATTADVVVTISASQDRPKIATAYVLSGCDTADFIEDTATVNYGGAGTSSPSTTITTANTGCFAIDCGARVADNSSGHSVTPGAGQTERIDQTVSGTYFGQMFGSTKTFASSGSGSMSWTSSLTRQTTMAAIAINESSGGGSSASSSPSPSESSSESSSPSPSESSSESSSPSPSESSSPSPSESSSESSSPSAGSSESSSPSPSESSSPSPSESSSESSSPSPSESSSASTSPSPSESSSESSSASTSASSSPSAPPGSYYYPLKRYNATLGEWERIG